MFDFFKTIKNELLSIKARLLSLETKVLALVHANTKPDAVVPAAENKVAESPKTE